MGEGSGGCPRVAVSGYRFTPAEAAELRRRHEAGVTVNALRREFGCLDKTVRAAIVRAGGVVRPRTYWKAERAADARGVRVVRQSENAKLGRVAATYAAKQSCPADCAFRGEGCYAAHTATAAHWNRMTAEAEADGMTPAELAGAEARLIRRTPADRDLRLHVAGDSTTSEGTRLIAAACADYENRGSAAGKRVTVWTYTHAWRQVERAEWGGWRCWRRARRWPTCGRLGGGGTPRRWWCRSSPARRRTNSATGRTR